MVAATRLDDCKRKLPPERGPLVLPRAEQLPVAITARRSARSHQKVPSQRHRRLD